MSLAAISAAVIFTSAGGATAQQTRAQQAGTENVILTLPQARALATRALHDDEPQIAARLARGLLLADEKSAYAYLILAHAHARMGQIAQARKAAAKSYRYADSKPERFQASELSAKLAYANDRPTAAQLWLRRAANSAKNEQVKKQLGLDFKRIKSESPLSFSVRGAVRPSSNVNNGADTALQIIDGLPVTGSLSGSAQAFSGVVASADARLSYRLRGTKTSRTEISTRLFVGRVALSDAAKNLSPTSSSSEFGSTYGALTLSHSFAVGKRGGSVRFAGTVGQYWSGGDRYYDFAKLEAGRVWKLGNSNVFQLATSIEDRDIVASQMRDTVVLGLTATLSHTRPTGDALRFSLNLLSADSVSVNSDYTAVSFQAQYAFAQKIGPARVTAGIALGATNYDRFYAAPIFVSDGRKDRSAFADLNLFFPDLDYAGFAPAVTLRAGRKSSNISRFDTREVSMSLGIASKF